jgi:hypothetical protein
MAAVAKSTRFETGRCSPSNDRTATLQGFKAVHELYPATPTQSYNRYHNRLKRVRLAEAVLVISW